MARVDSINSCKMATRIRHISPKIWPSKMLPNKFLCVSNHSFRHVALTITCESLSKCCPEFWCWRPLLEPSVWRRWRKRGRRIRFQTIYIHLLPTVDGKHAYTTQRTRSSPPSRCIKCFLFGSGRATGQGNPRALFTLDIIWTRLCVFWVISWGS